ncbi:MAG: VCBS repeat-containing protein, partial [Phycisphaerae bacterium]|nr:VCBS repeat-containing protein [Phycisphaerae bacterium]
YENDGEPEPSFTTRPLVYIPEHPESVYAVDLDGDGDLDILVANSWDDTILWFKNDGATPPSFVAQIVSDEAADVSAVFAMDMDGDADVDIVAATPDDDRIRWFENDGRQAPIFIPHEVSSNAIEGSAVFAADIDGDGRVDVVSASELDSKISWYEQGAEATPRAIPVPAEYPTIQLAINAALPVDEVVVAPGLYYGTIDFLGKPITVRSSDGPLVTTIDAFKEDPFVCDQAEPVVRFMRSEDRDSVLSGFTLTEGFGVFDGGSCTTLGGGAFIKGSSPTIAGCIFLANRGRGGALYYDDASPHITNCYFEANLYDAIDGRTSDVTFSDCVFRYHLTTALARFDVNLTFERCRILSSFGPAVSGGSSVVSLVDCVIGDNITGITTHPALSLTISGTLFCGNTEADIEGKYTDGGGNQFLARCPPPQDVDLDGVVGFTDLLDVLGSWGLCIACPADTDFSGEVDFVDLLSVLAAWGG